jgi:hypothetical protein
MDKWLPTVGKNVLRLSSRVQSPEGTLLHGDAA